MMQKIREWTCRGAIGRSRRWAGAAASGSYRPKVEGPITVYIDRIVGYAAKATFPPFFIWISFGLKLSIQKRAYFLREKLENAYGVGSTRENASPTFFPSKMPRQAMWQATYQVRSFLRETHFRFPSSRFLTVSLKFHRSVLVFPFIFFALPKR